MSHFQDHDADAEIPGHLEKPGRVRFEQRVARQRRHDWDKQERKRRPGNGRRAQQALRSHLAESL